MAQITTVEKIKLTFNPTTAGTSTNPGGIPAPVDGVPVWSIEGDNASGITLAPEPDGLSCYVISGDVAGEAVVTVKADADLDAGSDDPATNFREISVSETVTVLAAEAAGALLAAGTPEPK